MTGETQGSFATDASATVTATSPAHDAFISYSRGHLAKSLQVGLEKILRRWYQLRSFDIFRDESNLPPTADLPRDLKAELQRSRHLLLLLSPEAAQSRWVNDEVRWWLELNGAKGLESIVLILTAGELVWDNAAGRFDPEASTAMPSALFGKHLGEPRWEDLRWATDEQRLTTRHVDFRRVLISVAAELKGVSRDKLESDALKALRVNRLWAGSAVLALTLALTAALSQTWLTQNARILGEARLLQASSPAESFLVLRALANRWGAEPVVLPYLPPQSLLSTPITVWRKFLPEGAGYATFLPEGGIAAAGTDGRAYIWTSDGRLRLILPERISRETKAAVPLSRVIAIGPSGVATVDWKGCIRIFDLRQVAADFDGPAQTCLNVRRDGFGPLSWDSLGNIAFIGADHVHVETASGTRAVLPLPNPDVIAELAVLNRGSTVLVRTKVDALAEVDVATGAYTDVGKASQIGACDDGSAWAVEESGAFWSSTGRTKAAKLQGKGRWWVSSDCSSYIDGGGDLYIISSATPLRAHIAAGWSNPGTHVAASPGNRFIAVSNFEGQIIVHDLLSGAQSTLLGHTSRVFSLQFNGDSSRLITASYDNSMRIFDLRGGLVLPSEPVTNARSIYAGADGPLLSPDPYVADDLTEEDLGKPQTVKVLAAQASKPAQAAVRSDWRVGDRYLLLDTEGRKILICTKPKCPDDSVERAIGAETKTSGGGGRVRSSPDGRYLLAVEEGQQIRVYDLRRSDNVPLVRIPGADIRDATFDSSGETLFILSGERVLSVPFSLSSLLRLVDQRFGYCLTAEERQTYLTEWRWVASRQAAACPRDGRQPMLTH